MRLRHFNFLRGHVFYCYNLRSIQVQAMKTINYSKFSEYKLDKSVVGENIFTERKFLLIGEENVSLDIHQHGARDH